MKNDQELGKPMKTLSIKMVISAIAGVATIIAVIYIAYLSHRRFEEGIISQTQQQLLTTAGSATKGLEEFLHEHLQSLQILSNDPIIKEQVHNRVQWTGKNEFCRIRNFFNVHADDADALYLTDADGIVMDMDPVEENIIGTSLADRADISYVLREQNPDFEVLNSNVSNPTISISRPIFYEDRFAGIVGWMIEASTLSKHFVEPLKIGSNGYAWMFDNKNTVLSHPREDLIGMSVLDVIRRMHKERGQVLDENKVEEHIREGHGYLNRVKGQEQGYGIFVDCVTDKNDIVAFKRVSVGKTAFNLIMTLPYSEIIGPIQKHSRDTFTVAGVVILLLGAGAVFLFRSQKRKSELKAERKHLKQIAESAAALKESEEKLSGIVDSVTDAMIMVDEEFNISWANDIAMEMLGPDMVGMKCYRSYHGRNEVCDPCIVKLCFEDSMVHEFETEIIGADGNKLSFWCKASIAERHEDGRPKMVVEFLRDISERKRAEEALVRAKEDWENTFDSTTDMIMLLDDEHRILRSNRAAAEALRTTKEGLVGKKCYEAVHGQRRRIGQCPLALTIKTLKPHTTEITEPKLAGTFICSTSPILDHQGKITGYTHTLKDITKSKQLEAQFQQAQRLEAIGTLAGGIAHDFNNLLTGIQGNVSLMSLDMNTNHPHYERLKSIEKQVQSAARLTSHLLGYARKGKYEVKPVDLNYLVRETSETFGRTRKDISIHRQLTGELFAIEADSGQIEQVLWNLLVNAADAMPGAGDLILKTDNVTHEDMKGKVYDPRPGSYVVLTVTDTGMGMSKKTMERIFDPFFTTKEMGRGTGLGLASAYGIIKAHAGYIDVESEKGVGTTFSIYLPSSEKEVQKVVKTAQEVSEGTGTVLLIDDEEVILEVGQDLLEAMGYEVLTARDGKEAIEKYKDNRDRVDLVILDMVMPRMGGGEAYDKMKEINRNLKVLLSSGYSIDGQAKEILARGCDAFIQKPFGMQELSVRIRQVLDKK